MSYTNGIKIRRDTKEEMLMAVEDYRKIKDVNILGELKNDKWIDKSEDYEKLLKK